MDMVVTTIRPPAIQGVDPPAPGLTNSRVIMLDPSAMGRKVSRSDRLPVGSSAITGGTWRGHTARAASGGCRLARRRGKVGLNVARVLVGGSLPQKPSGPRSRPQ